MNTKQHDAAKRGKDQRGQETKELREEVKRLRAALTPFARAWYDWKRFTDPDSVWYISGGLSATDVIPTTMEPYEQAAEALRETAE